jgi:hypothetical protein
MRLPWPCPPHRLPRPLAFPVDLCPLPPATRPATRQRYARISGRDTPVSPVEILPYLRSPPARLPDRNTPVSRCLAREGEIPVLPILARAYIYYIGRLDTGVRPFLPAGRSGSRSPGRFPLTCPFLPKEPVHPAGGLLSSRRCAVWPASVGRDSV